MNEFLKSVFDLAPWIAVNILFIAVFIVAWVRVFAERWKADIRHWQGKAAWNDQDRERELYAQKKLYEQQLEQNRQNCTNQVSFLQGEIARLQNAYGTLYTQNNTTNDQLVELGKYLAEVRSGVLLYYKLQWLAYISQTKLATLEQISYKFVLPMIVFLGYSLDNISVGPKIHPIAAFPHPFLSNWLVSVRRSDGTEKRLFLVQIVEMVEPLTDSILDEAAQFALTAQVYKYVVVNGSHICACLRSTPRDDLIVDCPYDQIARSWEKIENELSLQTFKP